MEYGEDYPYSGEHLALLWLPYIASFASVMTVATLVREKVSELGLVHIILGTLAVVISILVVNADCGSPAAYAATISRVSASILAEGYVFMFVALTLFAYMFCRRVGELAWERNGGWDHSPWRLVSITDRTMMVGVLLTVVTGVVPDGADNCDLDGDGEVDPTVKDCRAHVFRHLHILGIGLGILISAVSAVVRAVKIFWRQKNKSPDVYNLLRLRLSFGIFCCSAVGVIVFLVVFFVIQSQVKEAQSMHLCVKYTTKDTCEGAGLPRTWLDATADVNLGNMSWPCSWNDAALVTDPYPCTNPNCGVEVLHKNANCIISEFDLLMFWLTTMLLVLQLMASQETGVWDLDKAGSAKVHVKHKDPGDVA